MHGREAGLAAERIWLLWVLDSRRTETTLCIVVAKEFGAVQQLDHLSRRASGDKSSLPGVAGQEFLGLQRAPETAMRGLAVAVVVVGLAAAGGLVRPKRRRLHQFALRGTVDDQHRRCDIANRPVLQRAVNRVELRTRLRRIADRPAQPAGLGELLRQSGQRDVGDLIEEIPTRLSSSHSATLRRCRSRSCVGALVREGTRMLAVVHDAESANEKGSGGARSLLDEIVRDGRAGATLHTGKVPERTTDERAT